MSPIFDISSRYVDELAALNAGVATSLGIPGHEREMPDYSPERQEDIVRLNRRTLDQLRQAPVQSDDDRLASDVMTERLGLQLELHQAKEFAREVGVLASPLQDAREIFDLMPRATQEDWANIAARLKLVPDCLTSYRRTLNFGREHGLLASKRLAREAAQQARVWAGLAEPEGQPGAFQELATAFEEARAAHSNWPQSLATALAEGVAAASAGYGDMHRYLVDEYLPAASDREAAGDERYRLAARNFVGAAIDLKETYDWGWHELYRLEDEMRKTASRIAAGASLAEVKELLETDPARAIEGADAYQRWLQSVHDQALGDLHGKHFDIPEPIRRIEAMIPPPGGALAPYYTGPSEDLTRPGQTWWPTGAQTRFPKWDQITTVYHEGVPGHHLQIATCRLQADHQSRFQRSLTFISGHGEGWALYAERLMAELGYFELPDYYLGMLAGQALRAVRVIVDLGMHLELAIPAGERFHPGEVWNHDLALEFAIERALQPEEFMASEVVRYLGWPGQAISYKVGERHWLEIREEAKRREGARFDLKRFHSRALELGPMGLDQLRAELSSLSF